MRPNVTISMRYTVEPGYIETIYNELLCITNASKIPLKCLYKAFISYIELPIYRTICDPRQIRYIRIRLLLANLFVTISTIFHYTQQPQLLQQPCLVQKSSSTSFLFFLSNVRCVISPSQRFVWRVITPYKPLVVPTEKWGDREE